MKPIETPRLTIRNWRDSDRPLFHEINSDPEVMEFFPFRRTRTESDTLMEALRERIDQKGYGFAALELRETGEPIGFAGLADTQMEPDVPAGTMEIGWRLARRFWGKGLVTEAARASMGSGFTELGLAENRFLRRGRQPPLNCGDAPARHETRSNP